MHRQFRINLYCWYHGCRTNMHVHANTDSTMISMQYTALDRDHQMSMYIAFALGLIIAS